MPSTEVSGVMNVMMLNDLIAEFVPISLFANDVSLPGTLQQAQCDILIGTVEKVHEFVQHMLSLVSPCLFFTSFFLIQG